MKYQCGAYNRHVKHHKLNSEFFKERTVIYCGAYNSHVNHHKFNIINLFMPYSNVWFSHMQHVAGT